MYVSIDIETLGIDPDTCDVIEFGAVIDNLEDPIEDLPAFHCYLTKDNYKGEPYAMSMHPKILNRIAKREKGFQYVPQDLLDEVFFCWLADSGYCTIKKSVKKSVEIVVAGKNFSAFDHRFLRRIPNFGNQVKFHRRIVDVGSMYYNPYEMAFPPSLDDCLIRCPGVTKKVEHNAVSDARDVIRCLRHKWSK